MSHRTLRERVLAIGTAFGLSVLPTSFVYGEDAANDGALPKEGQTTEQVAKDAGTLSAKHKSASKQTGNKKQKTKIFVKNAAPLSEEKLIERAKTASRYIDTVAVVLRSRSAQDRKHIEAELKKLIGKGLFSQAVVLQKPAEGKNPDSCSVFHRGKDGGAFAGEDNKIAAPTRVKAGNIEGAIAQINADIAALQQEHDAFVAEGEELINNFDQ